MKYSGLIFTVGRGGNKYIVSEDCSEVYSYDECKITTTGFSIEKIEKYIKSGYYRPIKWRNGHSYCKNCKTNIKTPD